MDPEEERRRLAALIEGHRADTLTRIADRCKAWWLIGDMTLRASQLAAAVSALIGLAAVALMWLRNGG